MSSPSADNAPGCVLCTSTSNCISHPAAEHFSALHRKDAEAYGLESRFRPPTPHNREDTPFCCARPVLLENRRAKGNPPSSVEGNIAHFVSAVNADEIEYMINDYDGTQDLVDAALEIIKVNPLTKGRVDDGTWIFLASGEDGAGYFGVFKTETIGFRMSGPRSYLFFTCKTCKRSYKIGYLSRTVNPTAGTETFEGDEKIDFAMGIPNKIKHRPTFGDAALDED